MASTIVWLRDDLRLDDNPALAAAAALPLTACAPQEEGGTDAAPRSSSATPASTRPQAQTSQL